MILQRKYSAAKFPVFNRGVPPDSFLDELIAWAAKAPEEIFAVNNRHDIYTNVRQELGPWTGIDHRRAVMCEALRVLAGFESAWNWKEGVDVTNRHSLTHMDGRETGIFQVSFDSVSFDLSLRECVMRHCGSLSVHQFIDEMKENHVFALEYAARLLRFTVRHNGPVLRKEINLWLRRAAVVEFQAKIEEAENLQSSAGHLQSVP